MPRDKPIPWPVVQRLPRYLTHVLVLRDEDVTWASSHDLAEALGLTSSTVRQDLSHLDLTGVSKRGYDTVTLERVLREELGSDRTHRIVIVGAGRLGCALLLHPGLKQHGFRACGIFEQDPEIVGTHVGKYVVKPVSQLSSVVRAKEVDVGVVAVPAEAAQEVTDRLVAAGVQGILNLAYVHLKVPDHMSVVDVRILARLQELAYALRMKEEDAERELDNKDSEDSKKSGVRNGAAPSKDGRKPR